MDRVGVRFGLIALATIGSFAGSCSSKEEEKDHAAGASGTEAGGASATDGRGTGGGAIGGAGTGGRTTGGIATGGNGGNDVAGAPTTGGSATGGEGAGGAVGGAEPTGGVSPAGASNGGAVLGGATSGGASPTGGAAGGGDLAGAAGVVLTDTLTQYGITWHLAEPALVGQFVNGDYYVVGPVTVVAITPEPLYDDEIPASEIGPRETEWRADDQTYVRNGFMLDPPANTDVAYDSAIRNYFQPDLVQRLPVAMQPGDSLVSTISMLMADEVPKMLANEDGPIGRREEGDSSPVRVAAVLTSVEQAPPADTFRPAFVDVEKVHYRASDLRRDALPRLDCPAPLPDVHEFARYLERPWVNTGWFHFDAPEENMPLYGREQGRIVGIAGLMLMCDLPAEEREQLLIRLVQVGIDRWGMLEGGHTGWEAWGGHHSGAKFPIVLAGILLGDLRMASPSVTYPTVDFQEDEQTGYGTSWTGADVVFLGHSGIKTSTGEPPRPDWGPYEHLHPSEWTDGNITSESYRRCCSSLSWVGQALTLRMLHAEAEWSHDAWFDYVDRWMTEDDTDAVAVILTETGEDYSADWARQGQCWDEFVENMWAQYRTDLP
ncbi:MAG: hypothetical protein JW751_06610 [Polyangiaceae bacterium]|nr:hypothetical protein [Polyangiaceae bacterium]